MTGGGKSLTKTLIASAILLAFSSAQAIVLTPPETAGEWTGSGRWQAATVQDPFVDEYTLSSGNGVFDAISASITPLITNSEFFITVTNQADLTVNGSTNLVSVSSVLDKGSFQQGTYAFHANNGQIHLKGDVEVVVTHNLSSEDQLQAIGANAFYAQNGGYIEIGSADTETKAWVLAAKPDLLSAKTGATIKIQSTHNKLVGSIDTVGNPLDGYGTVIGTFSGEDSYWFGDEQSWNNAELVSSTGLGGLAFQIGKQGAKDSEVLDLVFENGAQWSYLGVNDAFLASGSFANMNYELEVQSTAKRISNITLRNGGIINLFDEDIENTWKEIGLWDRLEDPDSIKHDYVRIGDLKGSNGIFRLDLNSDGNTQSDVIFIESSSDPGQHWIEPYRPSQLVSVSADNTLTFALTQEDANGVTFADKINIYGETLYDYELSIDSEKLDTAEKLDALEDEIASKYQDFDPNDYENGTKWFINRVTVSESAATVGVRSAAAAAYDAVVQLDRRDRRLRERAFFDDASNDGLWLRAQYGRLGADGAYKSDTTTLHVGYERLTSVNNRVGISFSYMDGKPDFEKVRGSGDLERYEVAVYDTLMFNNHYLDFVARLGHLRSDFSSINASGLISSSGDFSMNYGGVSAEYGYTMMSASGFFAEPQLQVQATRIDGYEYSLQRGMAVEAEQDTVLLGRAGIRFGKHFSSQSHSGEVYLRGDILHQFTDGQYGRIRDSQDSQELHWGNAGTWGSIGLGGYCQFAERFSMQFDLEKSVGGDTLDAWMLSGHLTYMF